MFNVKISHINTNQLLGFGSIAKVYPYQENGEDNKWVVKEIRCATARQLNLSIQEIVLSFNQNHRHINPITGFNIKWVDDEFVVYTKMPRMKRSLADLIAYHKERNEYLSEENIIECFSSIVEALRHLRCQNICHRDIKPSNILLDEENTVKLSDVGAAKYIPSQYVEDLDDSDSIIGTSGYMAPEIFKYSFTTPRSKEEWTKADIWSLGITIMELCLISPRHITFETSEEEIMDLISENLSNFKSRYSESLRDLLSNMLKFDAEDRINYDNIADALEKMGANSEKEREDSELGWIEAMRPIEQQDINLSNISKDELAQDPRLEKALSGEQTNIDDFQKNILTDLQKSDSPLELTKFPIEESVFNYAMTHSDPKCENPTRFNTREPSLSGSLSTYKGDQGRFRADQFLEDSLIRSQIHVSQDPYEVIAKPLVVWHDPNILSAENTKYIATLKQTYNLRTFVDWKDASEYLKKETRLSNCQVITSGKNGEVFIKEIYNLPFISLICVFAYNPSYHIIWAKQYEKKVKCVVSNFTLLLKNIRSSLKIDLPRFVPVFDNADLSEIDSPHIYLKGVMDFTNRHEAKEDFLNLALASFGKNHDISEFEKIYINYDMKTILNWYTRGCFLYGLVNNCLRLAKPDPILYCRLVLKDLETAIKDKYKQKSHKFSGLLYRGAYLSDNEWTRLQQNINRDIEICGFLSTTKKKDTAIEFCQENRNYKGMITIIVPNFPDKGEQGFAELREYSAFPDEDEVLFNVRSRFTVLEAALEEIDGFKLRHLILLYGAQDMRKYTTLHNPSVEIQISCNSKTVKCKVCKQNINLGDVPVVAVTIDNNNEYLCQGCMKQPSTTKGRVLLCVSPLGPNIVPSSSKKNDKKTLRIEGTVIQHQCRLDIPFYGVKCTVCQGTKLRCCYKCLDCTDTGIIYCNNCFHNQDGNPCIRQGHMIILQDDPFSFWSDKILDNRLHLKDQKEETETKNCLFQKGVILHKIHSYEKAIEYFQKYLEENCKSKNEETATCYNHLGEEYRNLGEYQKAAEYNSKGLEICKAVFGDRHPTTATCYNNLGSICTSLGEYQKAIEYHSKALQIHKEVFGEKHLGIFNSYEGLELEYNSLKGYQKAIEIMGIQKTSVWTSARLLA